VVGIIYHGALPADAPTINRRPNLPPKARAKLWPGTIGQIAVSPDQRRASGNLDGLRTAAGVRRSV